MVHCGFVVVVVVVYTPSCASFARVSVGHLLKEEGVKEGAVGGLA